jgi:hypothetical protein
MAKKKYVRKGMQFRYCHADSNALWEVKSKKGSGVWLCEIVDEPIEIGDRTYPGDYAGTERVFRSAEIIGAVNMEEMYQELGNQHDQFYAVLTPGQKIHYNNGFGEYVRCEVVEEDGKNKLRPIALVGNWSSHDLPYRRNTGEVYLGYYGEKIKNGDLIEPNYTSIWEANGDKMQSGDPTEMEPIDLSVPEMTEEEEQSAELWKAIWKIHDVSGNVDDPKGSLEQIKKLATSALKVA